MNPTDIDIARCARILPIQQIADKLRIPDTAIIPYGRYKAKVDLKYLKTLEPRQHGKLILVSAISPTPAGEGKTTTSVGLTDGLNRLGKQAVACLREPSLGPCFGMKGGAAGGGYAQVMPMEDINLHFTGDFHAIGAANNLLAALIDNHIHWGNTLNIDPRRISWKRVVDMNDRALRNITCGLGGPSNGFAREEGFDITVASEVMAIFCLAKDMADLRRRLANIVVGYNQQKQPINAQQLKADGPMAVLLKEALAPNLVQTLEHNPAFIHGGPFANIAHGCNSVIATRTALKLSDYVVTEAGFGADLGAEKFFNIKCPDANLTPDAAVIVATVKALKLHGGVAKEQLNQPNIDAVIKGCSNLRRHVENMAKFGVPTLVAVNPFETDSHDEIEAIKHTIADLNVQVVVSHHWSQGGQGAEPLARAVINLLNSQPTQFAPLYSHQQSLWDKAQHIATTLYGAEGIQVDKKAQSQIEQLEQQGYGHLPICIAKTPYSFSTDPTLKGAPSGHQLLIREVRLSAGAGFVVMICGDIMTMPGLPKTPAANHIRLNESGEIIGLF